jgi:hypothetical protein
MNMREIRQTTRFKKDYKFGRNESSHAVASRRMKLAIYLRLCVRVVAWYMMMSNQRFSPTQ